MILSFVVGFIVGVVVIIILNTVYEGHREIEMSKYRCPKCRQLVPIDIEKLINKFYNKQK